MTYTEKQLIEFGNYLLNRNTKIKHLQKTVTDADVENFKEGVKKIKKHDTLSKPL